MNRGAAGLGWITEFLLSRSGSFPISSGNFVHVKKERQKARCYIQGVCSRGQRQWAPSEGAFINPGVSQNAELGTVQLILISWCGKYIDISM